MIDLATLGQFSGHEIPFNYRYIKPLFDEFLLSEEQTDFFNKVPGKGHENPYNTSTFSIESHHKPISKIIDYSLFLKTTDDSSFSTE